MEKEILEKLKEEIRQLRIKNMQYKNAKRKDDQLRLFNEIKDKSLRLFKDFKLSDYDSAFTTSSINETDQIFFDLENVVSIIETKFDL